MTQQILNALAKLDTSNDNHWTAEGLPRLETVRMFAGDSSLTREQVTQAAPQYTRAATAAAGVTGTPAPAPSPAASPAANPPTAGTTQETAPPLPPPSPAAPEGLPSNAVTAPQPAEQVAGPSQDEVAAMEAELADITTDLERIDRHLAEVNKVKRERQVKHDDLQLRLDKIRAKEGPQAAVMGYLASQAKVREARAEQISRARTFEKEAGVRIVDLLPKRAPIDVAMARKTGYGTKRPGT